MISDFLHNTDNAQEAIDFEKLQKLPSESPIYDFYVARLWHKKVFIKRLKQEYQDNPFYLSALKKEFEIGISLNHPSIPVYRDYKKGTIVIDYIEGETLDNLIKTNRLFNNPNDIKKLIAQLIDVVDYLHQNNITHCDIKSDNIIICKATGNLILIDFDKCHTDSYDNTRANPENYGINKSINASSELDFWQISLIVKDLIPLISKPERKYFNLLILKLQKNKVDLEELRKILNKKFITVNLFRIIFGIIILLLILLFGSLMIFKKTPKEELMKLVKYEPYPHIEKERPDSTPNLFTKEEKEVSSISLSKKITLPSEKIKIPIDSVNELSKTSGVEEDINYQIDESSIKPLINNSDSNEPSVYGFQYNEKESIEILINRRMKDLLKPYAEYLRNYDNAVENKDISYDELTSMAQGSTDMLNSSMEIACNTLYREFPDIDKGEIQKMAWLSTPYLNLVNWNIEISERYNRRVLSSLNL